MERYVLVCNINGEASRFHNKITNEVCHKFNKRPQKLPAHITLKAPFETDKIEDMIEVLERFVSVRKKSPIKIEGFGKFRRDVVFMDVQVSLEAKKVHDQLIEELGKIPWIEFKRNEGKDKVFHCTILSRRIQDKFDQIWDYVNKYDCNFDSYFDNLSLYQWKDNTWILDRQFKFKESD
ncbi:2'-5' RNA ligase family protein [Clostridium sp. CX1]|uniref:2'-5' RNA ligase family protein n=1 Tax=Clostridium sp. CX1 TaxID=2978346 RepID=UPI0021BE84FF|nr:2'-5' RNA ligase family protein [Clostridium sp. CX1]MCT8976786.1 2'-5' RNA ligase family protein [Clostridium sp. CX1]